MSETIYTTDPNGAADTAYTDRTVYRTVGSRRGITDILSSIAQNAADLASAEVKLAKDEAIDTGKDTVTGGILTLFAGIIGIPVLIFLGLALTAALLPAIGAVAANLITAVVFALVAFALYGWGRSKIGGDGETLGQTKQNLRRDRATVKENLH